MVVPICCYWHYGDETTSMIYNPQEIEEIRKSCKLVSETLAEIKKYVRVGFDPLYIDHIAEKYIIDRGGKPAFKGYRGFPNSLCVSLNEEVVHGIPTKKKLRNGDVVSIDCGVELNGFFGDLAYTFCIGTPSNEIADLIETTKEALMIGIQQAIPGNHVGDIGTAIETYMKPKKFGIVRELSGHGVGRNLHEAPCVPNFFDKESEELVSGMVLAIEPMITLGERYIKRANDDWTIYTIDRKPSAHFEHTILITEDKPEILTNY